MSYNFQDINPQNSIGNVPNGFFQLVRPPPIFSPSACPIPISLCPLPNPMNQNQVPVFPVQFFQQNQRFTHPNQPKHAFNDQHVNMSEVCMQRPKPSPIKSPIVPLKRHKFNEADVNDTESIKFDSNSDYSSGSNEGLPGLEVDSLFYELQCFASEGCGFAENVAKGYRKRPCFKKIELLLSRLKNELNVYHNIMSNINSQGTAWAIKDFIFVFSRLVNAWIIMRGYVYDKTDGLDDLRKDYDPNFCDYFIEWQEATLKMMKTLMGTIENLDVTSQNKSGNKQKKKEVYVDINSEIKEFDKEFLENFQKDLFSPKYAENSEELQVRNHQTRSYFRAGILKPLQINPCNSPTNSMNTPTTPDSDILKWLSYDDLNDSPFQFNSGSERLYNRKSISLPVTPMEEANKFDVSFKSRAKKDLSAKFNSMNIFNRDIEAELDKEFSDVKVIIDENDNEEEKLKKMYKNDASKVAYLIKEVSQLSSNDNFDICTSFIIENIKNGKYASFNSILDEFKFLVKHAKSLIEGAKDDKTSLMKFVSSLEAIINRKAFENIN